ncbi:MAG: ferric reductase-like transmembrane domain-containing protein [Arenicella sp.]|nr:ferric reductase-like transmembrane domain-containing protein [Arenicella sp.]
MTVNIFYILAVFCIALLATPVQSADWVWESANGLGFIAFAGLLILSSNGKNRKGHSILHKWLGIAVLMALVFHVVWFLGSEFLLIEYLKLGSPPHMAIGIVAFMCIALLSISSLKAMRGRAYINNGGFRIAHRYLSIASILLSALHIVLSGYYFVSITQYLLLLMIVVLSYLVPAVPGNKSQAWGVLIVAISALLMFVWLRGLGR